MRDALPLVVLALVAYVGARVWAHRHRKASIADLFALPWWQWPLARLAIRRWKRAAHMDALWDWCGYGEPPKTTSYITISGWEWDGLQLRRRDKVPWVKIRVAPGFPQGDEEFDGKKNPKRELVAQARGDFDLGPVDAAWNFRYLCRHVVLTPKEVVPTKAFGMAPDVAAVVAANLTPTQVVPAIGKGDRPITHDAKADAPHALISGTTMGGGKSATLRTFGIQYYSTGSDLLILDPVKRASHLGWAIEPDTQQPWPGIVYVPSGPDRDAYAEAAWWIVRAGQEIARRGDIANEAIRRGETVTSSRLVILLDDMNGLTSEFRRRKYDDARHYLSLLLWAGREVNFNIIAAFQRASARAALDGDVRECFGLRIVADGSEKTTKMIADQVDLPNMPKVKPHKVQPGHSAFVYGSLALEAQRIFYTDDEARAICAAEARRRRHQAIEARSSQVDARTATAAVGALDVPQVGHAADNGKRSEPQADRPGEHREHGQHEAEDEGKGVGVHVDIVRHVDIDVKGWWELDGERDDQSGVPAGPRSWDGAAAALPPNNHAPSRSGSSLSSTVESSMQEIEAVSRIDENDGEINYLTLGDLAEQDWCTTTYHSLRTYANPEKDYDFPDPIEGFSNPRRWSERDVRNWLEDFQAQGGAKSYGVYFVRPPGSATVKIGRTGNLKARLRRWNLGEQCVLRWLPCTSKRDSIRLENAKHEQYKDYHEHLEWFWIEGDLARDLGLPEVVRT